MHPVKRDPTTETLTMTRWDQQRAKAKFSEIVRRARTEGPQLVTTRGANPVVTLSAEDYQGLIGARPRGFGDLLLSGDDLVPERAVATADYQPFDP